MNKASYQYTCEICLQQFGRKSSLTKHARMHESEPQINATAVAGGKRAANTIPCDQCDKLFKTVTTLKKHKNDKHVNVPEDIIDGVVAPPAPPVKAAKGQMNGSEEYIMIDSSLDEECIDGIGEPVIRPSKREARSHKKDAELGTIDSNGSEVHNDGSNVSMSSMSSRSSDIQDAGDVACLPNEPRDVEQNGCRFENESTSAASIRLSLSASEEDDAQEASLCLNNLFDETAAHQDSNQVNKERDQEMPELNGHAGEDEEEPAEGRDESDSQSVDSLDKPAVLKRKRPADEDDEAAPETDAAAVADADASLVKSSSKKTRLDDSASQQQPRSYLGKCIIL